MMATTSIEWTDATWNPVTGCSKVSPGCANCYAERIALRKMQPYDTGLPWTAKNAEANIVLHPERLEQPLRWKKPRRVFVNSMSDLFHEQVPDEFIDRVFAVMATSHQHDFQVLTKRSKRMREWFRDSSNGASRETLVYEEYRKVGLAAPFPNQRPWPGLPFPNVWLGVSCEDQKTADERMPDLLATPAAVRFVSAEPLLGPIDFSPLGEGVDWNYLTGENYDWRDGTPAPCPSRPKLNWVIAGGESGPGARPMHPDWARSIRDQCVEAGVPFFFKQWGAWGAHGQFDRSKSNWQIFAALAPSGEYDMGATCWNGRKEGEDDTGEWQMYRVGKKAAGRLLDGREWNEFPEA